MEKSPVPNSISILLSKPVPPSAMYQHIIEKNERRGRQAALWLAITLHVGLAIALYLQTSQKPEPQKNTPTIERPVAKPRPAA